MTEPRKSMRDRNPLEAEADAVAAQAGRNDLDRYRSKFAAAATLEREDADAEVAKLAALERLDREGGDDAQIYADWHERVAAARAAHAAAVAAAEARFAAADAELSPRAARLSAALVEGRQQP